MRQLLHAHQTLMTYDGLQNLNKDSEAILDYYSLFYTSLIQPHIAPNTFIYKRFFGNISGKFSLAEVKYLPPQAHQ